jgi:N-acetylmuramoyl-L-alanine amidase
MMFYIRGRSTWGAASPKTAPTKNRWGIGVTVVVHHTAGAAPRTLLAEQSEMRAIQRLHQNARGWNDIGYNYVIAPSGRVYEGRGYGIVGAHTENHNTGTVGISFMGNYQNAKPSLRSLVAYRLLVRKLKVRGARIRSVTGHKFMPGQSTACPGENLVKALKLR